MRAHHTRSTPARCERQAHPACLTLCASPLTHLPCHRYSSQPLHTTPQLPTTAHTCMAPSLSFSFSLQWPSENHPSGCSALTPSASSQCLADPSQSFNLQGEAMRGDAMHCEDLRCHLCSLMIHIIGLSSLAIGLSWLVCHGWSVMAGLSSLVCHRWFASGQHASAGDLRHRRGLLTRRQAGASQAVTA